MSENLLVGGGVCSSRSFRTKSVTAKVTSNNVHAHDSRRLDTYSCTGI